MTSLQPKPWWRSSQVWLGIIGVTVDVVNGLQAVPGVHIPPGIATSIVVVGGIILRNLGKTVRPLSLK